MCNVTHNKGVLNLGSILVVVQKHYCHKDTFRNTFCAFPKLHESQFSWVWQISGKSFLCLQLSVALYRKKNCSLLLEMFMLYLVLFGTYTFLKVVKYNPMALKVYVQFRFTLFCFYWIIPPLLNSVSMYFLTT